MAQENSLEIPIPKPDTSWRRNPDGTYNDKPSDPEYFKKYYHEQFKTQGVQKCVYCERLFNNKQLLNKHQRRNRKCKQIQETLAQIQEMLAPLLV